MEPEVGIEPTTYRLQACLDTATRASTSENADVAYGSCAGSASGVWSFAPRLMPRGVSSSGRAGHFDPTDLRVATYAVLCPAMNSSSKSITAPCT
jgi:hypothetical protein